MDYANERYVRNYTRDTDDWLSLVWQGRAIYHLLRRKCDRSGVIETRRGAHGIAAVINMPLDVVAPGLRHLIEFGFVKEFDGGYIVADFIESEETPRSDAQRARDSRFRRHKDANDRVTKRDDESQTADETYVFTDLAKAVLTGRDGNVTPSLASPSSPSDPAVANDVTAAARELVKAANRAIEDRFSEQANPLRPGHGPSVALAQAVLELGIPVEFAQSSIARQVAESCSKPPSSMKYFLPGIEQDFEEHNAREEARASSPVVPLDRSKRTGTRAVDLVRAKHAKEAS